MNERDPHGREQVNELDPHGREQVNERDPHEREQMNELDPHEREQVNERDPTRERAVTCKAPMPAFPRVHMDGAAARALASACLDYQNNSKDQLITPLKQ